MEGTIGEIRMFAGNFAPRNWAFCQGQLISIASNTALFSILGVSFGGNGSSTFGLPQMAGRVPIGVGQGAGLSFYTIGQTAGTDTGMLTSANLPPHTHQVTGTVAMGASTAPADRDTPQGNYPAVMTGTDMYNSTNNGSTMAAMQLNNLAVGMAGSSLPYSTRQPVLAMNFIICMFGVFPARN